LTADGRRWSETALPWAPCGHRVGTVGTRIGDWEGDLIVGRASRSAIGTLVDRRTGYLRLVHLPDRHSAEQLRVAMLPVLTTAICVRSPRVRRRRPAGKRLRAGRHWQCGP
jgi:IS30 family transposase